jgi:hypothetical protein
MPLMKPGPKTEPFLGQLKPRTHSMDDLSEQMAGALGDGNVSKGYRLAVRFAYDCYQAQTFTPGRKNAAPVAPTLPGSPRPTAAQQFSPVAASRKK